MYFLVVTLQQPAFGRLLVLLAFARISCSQLFSRFRFGVAAGNLVVLYVRPEPST
jgi:hypothetical protein